MPKRKYLLRKREWSYNKGHATKYYDYYLLSKKDYDTFKRKYWQTLEATQELTIYGAKKLKELASKKEYSKQELNIILNLSKLEKEYVLNY